MCTVRFKVSVVILLSIIQFSCQSVDNEDKIIIDLDEIEERLEYSSFVDSVSYVTLQMKDDAYIGGLERLYKWGNFYYVWGTHRSGIFIFDASGKLYAHINSFGEGPESFRMISSFTIVKSSGDVCIMDYASQKMKYFTKEGDFRKSVPCPYWSVDIAAFNPDNVIFISPFYAGEENPNGIWMTDMDKISIRHLRSDVMSNHQLYYYPMTYCWGDTCIYYYDRNWDYLSSISPNGMKFICQFDVKQKIPASMIPIVNNDPFRLNGYAICDKFVYAPTCVLMLFCKFGKEGKRSYIWAMLDMNEKQINLANDLYNDLDDVLINSRNLFQLDESTWARVFEEEDDNFNVKIQLLHLKKGW